MAEVLKLTGPVLMGPDDIRDCVWVVDGHITFTAPPGASDITEIAGWVLPGLVDAHCHVGLGAEGAVSDREAERQAITDRDHGTLLIRDAGSPADTRWIDQRHDLPRVIRAGRHLARPKRYIRGYAHEIEPEQLAEYMAAQAQLGDGWVKLVGDWIDRALGDLDALWPAEAAKAGIAAAHEHGAKVTAHCFATESLRDLVEAGIDCIEHATGLNEELIDLFAERDVAIVPTLVNIDTFPQIAAPAQEKYPKYFERMMSMHERRYDTIGAAHEAGIRVFCGTDAGGSIAHGLVPDEVVELTKAGMTNVEALDAACWGAREWLGRPSLDEGAPADFVVYDEDPRADLAQLKNPRHIVLRGQTV